MSKRTLSPAQMKPAPTEKQLDRRLDNLVLRIEIKEHRFSGFSDLRVEAVAIPVAIGPREIRVVINSFTCSIGDPFECGK